MFRIFSLIPPVVMLLELRGSAKKPSSVTTFYSVSCQISICFLDEHDHSVLIENLEQQKTRIPQISLTLRQEQSGQSVFYQMFLFNQLLENRKLNYKIRTSQFNSLKTDLKANVQEM